MTALEIVLLLIGIICVAVSFIFFMKIDGSENVQSVNVSLSDKQREAIKGQISAVFKEQTDELTRNIEVNTRDALEHLSNEKIKELSEYSDTVLADINKNHTEVMFLYDMLNEKNKEVHNNIRDMQIATEAAKEVMAQQNEAAQEQKVSEVQEKSDDAVIKPKTAGKPSAKITASKTSTASAKAKNSSGTRKRTTKPKTEDGEAAVVKETQSAVVEQPADEQVMTAAGNASETLADDKKAEKPISNENKKEAVLSLYNEGKSNVEIAKTLGIGVGEVKLVIDLFKGIK